MGITQLAISYCSALVDDTAKRTAFFPGFDFSAGVATAFNSGAKQNQIIDPLMAKMVGANISTQPNDAATRTEIGTLIGHLAGCSGAQCSTNGVVKGACASALGSAAMLVQ